jgi:hypothetical protein
MKPLKPIVDGQLLCSACDRWLPVETFGSNWRFSTGKDCACRPCMAERAVRQYWRLHSVRTVQLTVDKSLHE